MRRPTPRPPRAFGAIGYHPFDGTGDAVLFSPTANLQPPVGASISGDSWIHIALTSSASTKVETLYSGAETGRR